MPMPALHAEHLLLLGVGRCERLARVGAVPFVLLPAVDVADGQAVRLVQSAAPVTLGPVSH